MLNGFHPLPVPVEDTDEGEGERDDFTTAELPLVTVLLIAAPEDDLVAFMPASPCCCPSTKHLDMSYPHEGQVACILVRRCTLSSRWTISSSSSYLPASADRLVISNCTPNDHQVHMLVPHTTVDSEALRYIGYKTNTPPSQQSKVNTPRRSDRPPPVLGLSLYW